MEYLKRRKSWRQGFCSMSDSQKALEVSMMVDMSFRIKVAFDECTSSVVPRRLSLVEHGALGVVGRFRGFMTRFRRNVDGSLSWTWKHEFVNISWPMLKAWLYLVLPVKASLLYTLWPDIIKLKMLMINLHQLPFCCWCTYIDMDTVKFLWLYFCHNFPDYYYYIDYWIHFLQS